MKKILKIPSLFRFQDQAYAQDKEDVYVIGKNELFKNLIIHIYR